MGNDEPQRLSTAALYRATGGNRAAIEQRLRQAGFPADDAGGEAYALGVAVQQLDDHAAARAAAEAAAAAWVERAGLFAPWRLGDFPADVQESAWRFLRVLTSQRADQAPCNLLVLGMLGTRKTSCAWAICHAAQQAGVSFVVAQAGEFAASLLPDGGGHVEDYTSPGLLVLDDVGDGTGGTVDLTTNGRAEVLLRVIDRRYWNARPTIITANLDEAALQAAVGDRCFDRLTHRYATIRLAGPNYRHRPALAAVPESG